jgi:hypothetical protein
MASLILSGSTSGSVTLSSPAVSGTTTLTLPTTTSTLAINGPAFSANFTSSQSFASGVVTKVQCNTEVFDTNSNYDATTNYRFTPTVAGYYQVNAQIGFTVASLIGVQLFKNGSAVNSGQIVCTASAIFNNISSLIYCNGSTDYIEFYAYQSSGISAVPYYGDAYRPYFQASLVRSA